MIDDQIFTRYTIGFQITGYTTLQTGLKAPQDLRAGHKGKHSMITSFFSQGFYNSNARLFSAVQTRSFCITDKAESFPKRASQKTRVFISHKHDDLDGLTPLIALLEEQFSVEAYIDSRDSKMPKVTSSQTAARIKNMISICDKFILLATNGAIESKWCNWELGYGDAEKLNKKNIALFVFSTPHDFKGREYMELYPYIVHSDGNEKYTNGSIIQEGFYVVRKENGTNIFERLSSWLKRY